MYISIHQPFPPFARLAQHVHVPLPPNTSQIFRSAYSARLREIMFVPSSRQFTIWQGWRIWGSDSAENLIL
jgi:hypothetical protein